MTEFRTNDNDSVGVASGSIYMYAGTSAPNGWLICNGGSYSITDYGDLFSVIGYGYGGSGNSFKVPDLVGKIIRGASNPSSLNSTGGKTKDSVTLTTANLPSHSHKYDDAYYASDPGSVAGAGVRTDNDNSPIWRTSDDRYKHGHAPNIYTSSTGSDSAFSIDTIPKHLEFNYIIKI